MLIHFLNSARSTDPRLAMWGKTASDAERPTNPHEYEVSARPRACCEVRSPLDFPGRVTSEQALFGGPGVSVGR